MTVVRILTEAEASRDPIVDTNYAVVDVADLKLVSGFAWRKLANGYVAAQRGKMTIYLHRLIAGAGPDELVDHANGDPLDRRRGGTTSRHKGVSWNRERSVWRAYIHVDGRTRALGSFKSEDDAARAYNAAAVEVWGEFARLNDVPELEGAVDGR